jgi:hypothetical protein
VALIADLSAQVGPCYLAAGRPHRCFIDRMPWPPQTTVYARGLADGLRQLRNSIDLTAGEVAEDINRSRLKISKPRGFRSSPGGTDSSAHGRNASADSCLMFWKPIWLNLLEPRDSPRISTREPPPGSSSDAPRGVVAIAGCSWSG